MVGTMMENVPTGEKTLQYQCKVTVLETKCFPDLQKKFLADPESGPCPCFKAGQEFLFERTPENDGFYHLGQARRVGGGNWPCAEAWYAVSRYIYAALQGGAIMRKWTNDDRMMIAYCNDGTRPVIFKIERIDIPETDKAVSTSSSKTAQAKRNTAGRFWKASLSSKGSVSVETSTAKT